MNILSWTLRLIVAFILAQTLYFKFAGAAESVWIFEQLLGKDAESIGRIGSGIVELIAVILLLIPRTKAIGALLALGTITGAIFSHLTKLGISVQDGKGNYDGGTLFALAVVVFVCSAILLVIHRRELPIIGAKL